MATTPFQLLSFTMNLERTYQRTSAAPAPGHRSLSDTHDDPLAGNEPDDDDSDYVASDSDDDDDDGDWDDTVDIHIDISDDELDDGLDDEVEDAHGESSLEYGVGLFVAHSAIALSYAR